MACGDCKVCCKRFAVVFNKGIKRKDVPCKYQCSGCTVYDNRPVACRDFNCLWLTNELPVDLRPDKTSVMAYAKPDVGGGVRIMLEEVEPGSFDIKHPTPAQVDLTTAIIAIAAGQEGPVRLFHRSYDRQLKEVDLPRILREVA